MELRHTQGPWHVSTGPGWNETYIVGERVGAHEATIATVRSTHVNQGCYAANARLIAAAPELLAALVALTTNRHGDLGDMIYHVRDREGLGWDGPAVSTWADAVALARAAIVKATGSAA